MSRQRRLGFKLLGAVSAEEAQGAGSVSDGGRLAGVNDIMEGDIAPVTANERRIRAGAV